MQASVFETSEVHAWLRLFKESVPDCHESVRTLRQHSFELSLSERPVETAFALVTIRLYFVPSCSKVAAAVYILVAGTTSNQLC